MSSIRDVVQIQSGYTSYVNLAQEYYALEQSRARMARYQPITAHRLAFEEIAQSLNPKDRRFYFLSGSYGTGKSHLCLMLANYFASPSDVPEMAEFFEHYAAAQKQVRLKPGEMLKERAAASLKAARGTGRFLVAICRYDLNLELEGVVLRALEEALGREGSALQLDSIYCEALRRLSDWQARQGETRFFAGLTAELQAHHSDWTVGDLIKGLQNRDEGALQVFKAGFAVVTDNDFGYKKDNLQAILTDIISNAEFKAQYKGLAILYDEFGYALDDRLVSLKKLESLAEFCASSGLEQLPVVFVGTGHKAFRNHGEVGDAVHYATLEARVTEVALQTQGMEDIIAAIVQPRREASAWASEVAPQSGIFTWLSGECKRLGLFDWLPAPKLRSNIIENIYPMHPLATYALLRLASEAGSDNRSVFRFFAPEFETGEQGWLNVQEYSYPWFIEQHEIVEGGQLALYTADLLVDYFRESLKPDNRRLSERVKNAIVNYEATLRELGAYTARASAGKLFDASDELMERILKVMLILECVSTEQRPIPNTAQNILFALHARSDAAQVLVRDRLDLLCQAGVLYDRDGVYELTRGDRKDIRRMVEQYKAMPWNRPTDLLAAFQKLCPLTNDETFLEAKDYNAQYDEDKRLKVVFATPTMLENTQTQAGGTVSFFQLLEASRASDGYGKKGYEGTAVYVFCESDQDMARARKAVRQNDQQRIVVAVPRAPISVFDAVFTLQALDSISKSKEAESFGPFENVQISELRKTANDALIAAKAAYFSSANVEWFGVRGARIPVKETRKHDVADHLMTSFYTGWRNTFAQPEFNRSHVSLTGPVRNYLREAGEILTDLGETIQINWTWPENRGARRYLRHCFVDHQALRLLGVEGEIRSFEAEQDVNKFREHLPAYAYMLAALAALEGHGPTSCQEFLRPYFEVYGQGELAITLFLLMARRFYGDSLRFKPEPDALVDLTLDSTERVTELLNGQMPRAVILFEQVSQEDKDYFAALHNLFAGPGAAGRSYSVRDAFQALTAWWQGLPILARSEAFYASEHRPLATLLNQSKTKDAFSLVKHDLLELLDLRAGEKLSSEKLAAVEARLQTFKALADGLVEATQQRVLGRVQEIFGAPTTLDVDIQQTLKDWYTHLSTAQKDQLGNYHNNDSKPLIKKLDKLLNVRELLCVELPQAYGIKPVADWSTDLMADYTARIARGKQHIEQHAPQVPDLRLQFEGEHTQQGSQVSCKAELCIHVDTEGSQGVIYYTDDGSDPCDEKSARQALQPGKVLTIKGNRKVKLVVSDQKGAYGKVETLEVVDELAKYVIKRPPQVSMGDELIQFVFPKDRAGARIAIRSLFSALTQAGSIDQTTLGALVAAILQELGAGHD